MEYRTLPNGEKISTIGFGVGNLEYVSDNEIERIFSIGIKRGINFLDICMSTDTAAYPIAKVIKGKREKLLLQNHFCISYPKGGYERIRDLNGVKDAFAKELKKYGTDYTDIGMIHFIEGRSPTHGESSTSPPLSAPSGRGEPYQPKEQMIIMVQGQAAKQAAQKKAAEQRAM